jgi:MFS family permease
LGWASGIGYISALSTNAKNFSAAHRGKVLGLISSGFGLSATLMSLIYVQGLADKSEDSRLPMFFALMGCLSATAYLMGVIFLRVYPVPELGKVVTLENYAPPVHTAGETADTSLLSQHTENSTANVDWTERQVGLIEAAKHLFTNARFWEVYLPFFVGTGGGLFLINNLAAMQESLAGDKDKNVVQMLVISLAVSMIMNILAKKSQMKCVQKLFTLDHYLLFLFLLLLLLLQLCNFSGRVIIGWLSDVLRIPREYYFSACLLVLSITFFASSTFPFHHAEYLYITTAFAGFAYGGIWAVTPAMLSEMFGLKNFGKVFGLTATAPGLSSTLFNQVAGAVYSANTKPGDDNTCYGRDCHAGSLLFAAIMSLVAAVVSSIVFQRRMRKQ